VTKSFRDSGDILIDPRLPRTSGILKVNIEEKTRARIKYASSIIERLCFLRGPCRKVILKIIGSTVQFRVQLWNVNQRATEAEESPGNV
jgi:hypothetical protein